MKSTNSNNTKFHSYRCAKRQVIAIIENNGKMWFGENWCHNHQSVCPRLEGEGYDKCRSICNQNTHAEVEALHNAGDEASGGILTIIGHDHFCEDCGLKMKACGIKQAIMWKDRQKITINII